MIDIFSALNTIYLLNMQVRVINIILLILIWYSYIRTRKVMFQKGRNFTLVLGLVTINIIFDIIAVYGLFHKNEIPYALNRAFQLCYLESFLLSIYGIYMHIMSLCGKKREWNKPITIIQPIPLIAAMIVIVFLPVDFYQGFDGAYSYGTMTQVAFIAVCIYLTLAAVGVLVNRRRFKKEYFRNIAIGIIMWTGFITVQLYKPNFLLAGTGITVMMLANFLNFEDPKLYINYETGCFNSIAYRKMLKKTFAKSKEFCVCNIAFHEFEIIHGRYGHDVCQEILVNIAKIVGSYFGTDVYSVDEETISVILSEKKYSYDDLDLLLKMIDYDYVVNENIIHITGYIDVVRCPEDADSLKELEDVLDFMKKSSKREKNLYVADHEFLDEKKRYSTIVQMLEFAINNDGFEMFYQPIFSTKEKKFHSAEALIRLKDKETMGFVSPEDFIPIAEKEGMIMQIGEIVLSKVCRFAKDSDLVNKGIRYIEVNLSGIQCIDQGMPDQVSRIAQKYDLPCGFLNLEITETVAVESGELLNRNMMRLKSMGTTFSMDDFGTGYSNLAQMAETPYELIKIDKSLIWYCYPVQRKLIKEDEEDDQTEESVHKSKAVLTKVIELINDLNLKIVAEGVETKEMVDMLTELGVDYLQGFYFSRPLDEEHFVDFINNKADRYTVDD